MMSPGDCTVLIKLHSMLDGPSQRQAVSLNANRDIWEDLLQESLTITSKLSLDTPLSFLKHPASLFNELGDWGHWRAELPLGKGL